MKEKIFNIIQIGDKSNKISRAFDIFITIIIVGNIIVTFLETFDRLASFSVLFKTVEVVTVFVFCVEYILRIWTANYLYPEVTAGHARFKFLISFDGIVDLLTIIPAFFLSGFVICFVSMQSMIHLMSSQRFFMKNETRLFLRFLLF